MEAVKNELVAGDQSVSPMLLLQLQRNKTMSEEIKEILNVSDYVQPRKQEVRRNGSINYVLAISVVGLSLQWLGLSYLDIPMLTLLLQGLWWDTSVQNVNKSLAITLALAEAMTKRRSS